MIMPVITAILIALAVALFFWRRARNGAAQNREQAERKRQEDALDRALSNGVRRSDSAQVLMEVHYSVNIRKESEPLFRLTEQTDSVTKEYLFQRTELVTWAKSMDIPLFFGNEAKTSCTVSCSPIKMVFMSAFAEKRSAV